MNNKDNVKKVIVEEHNAENGKVTEHEYMYEQFQVKLVKKVQQFKLSFQPNETKKLTIKYNIPMDKQMYNPSKGTSYDFSPIFNWKNGIVKEVEI
jgi:hypothetical protein